MTVNPIFRFISVMYTVEFQKRGLPYAHILLGLNSDAKLKIEANIDNVITTELPDSRLYPKLSEGVAKYMIHGSCGPANINSPCMTDKRCSKFYPKPYTPTTMIDQEGYPRYRRRVSGIHITKHGVELDNRNVVPYNSHLLMRYGGHVNVEYCNKSNSIKYLFKYVKKGPNKAALEISNREGDNDNAKDKVVDEIKQYYDCIYVSSCEAVWRIFKFDIHHKWPPVFKLKLHLENEQSACFHDYDPLTDVVKKNEEADTMFLAWFEANRKFPEGRNLTYAEFPTKFTYHRDDRMWLPRKKGYNIGRLQ